MLNKFLHPRFIARQLYRLLVIWPFEMIVFALFFVRDFFPISQKEGSQIYFLVTSVVYFSEKRLTYSGTRSIYSPEERIQQTIETVNSIRKKVPSAKIIILEAGQKEDIPAFTAEADQYLYIGKDFFVRKAVDSRFKSLGEVAMLMAYKTYLPNDAKMYFKISGRYVLNDDFVLSSWLTNSFKFFSIRNDFVSTRLYSFSGAVVHEWFRSLIKSLPYLVLDYPIEFLLYKWVPKKLQETVAVAGVSGCDATTGKGVKE